MVQVRPDENEYESLMCLISETLPLRSFGICYGGGCCGTCGVIMIDNGTGYTKFVLACEIPINEKLENKAITVHRV